MATTKKRLNITLPEALDEALGKLASRDKVPQATKASELLRVALEIEEDIVLDTIAAERLKTNKKWVSHKKIWS